MEQSIYPNSSVLGEPYSLERYTKNDIWSTPVGTAPGFLAPSTPSSSASSSSLTLDEDEAVWGGTFKRDHDALKLVDLSGPGATLSNTKTASHIEWLHQFAEQARRAHLRNVSRSMDVSAFMHAAFRPLDDNPMSSDVAHKMPESLLLQAKQPWLSAFRRGCVTADGKARRMHAQSVVALGAWDADALAELANKVVDRISESYGEGFAVLAPFAQDIARCLAANVGEAEADWFGDLLRESLLAEFTAWWDMDLPTSVAMLRYEFHWDVYRLFDIAFAVAAFVGDAFAHGLLAAGAVHHCLALLIRKLSTLEQVQAAHAILTHADGSLCDGRTLVLLIRVLKFRAGQVPAGTSVLGESFVEEDVWLLVLEMDELVDDWVEAGPSLKQDEAIEDAESDDVVPARVRRPSSRHWAQDAESSDEVIPAHAAPQTKRGRTAPLLYSDAVKKQKKA